jgi:ribosomal protein L37E
MNCLECGAKVADVHAAFCSSCGAPLAAASGRSAGSEHERHHLQLGRITSAGGEELTMSLMVDERKTGHIVVGIVPAEEYDDPTFFFTDLEGLAHLKQLIAGTEAAAQEAARSGRLRKLGY